MPSPPCRQPLLAPTAWWGCPDLHAVSRILEGSRACPSRALRSALVTAVGWGAYQILVGVHSACSPGGGWLRRHPVPPHWAHPPTRKIHARHRPRAEMTTNIFAAVDEPPGVAARTHPQPHHSCLRRTSRVSPHLGRTHRVRQQHRNRQGANPTGRRRQRPGHTLHVRVHIADLGRAPSCQHLKPW